MAKIHNTKARMPAFLNPNDFMEWINPELGIRRKLDLITPVRDEFIDAHEIEEIG